MAAVALNESPPPPHRPNPLNQSPPSHCPDPLNESPPHLLQIPWPGPYAQVQLHGCSPPPQMLACPQAMQHVQQNPLV